MNDLIGRTIAGRYHIEAFLGKGGMAEVYKVWDQERSVHLAMKILHADLAEDKVFLRRFKREAQTLSKLQHPNIVRFYGLEQDGDLVYILMDYVEGTTLRKEIFQSKAPFSMERILEIIKPVCAALYYAHKSGFVHCDVKPANIMIHRNGEIYVSDFGIARMTEASTVTMVGAGTPAYMAPEQARGETPVPQTDMYSLGVVLFEMLTGGERPFTGENARTTGSTSEKVRWEQMRLNAPPPSKFNPSLAPSIDAIVLKCLEKSPTSRYLSATDLLSDLMRQVVQITLPVQTVHLSIESQDEKGRQPTFQQEEPAVTLINTKKNQPFVQQESRINLRLHKALGFIKSSVWVIIILVVGLALGLGIWGQSPLAIPPSPTFTFIPTSTPTRTATPLPTKTPTPPATRTFTPFPKQSLSSMLGALKVVAQGSGVSDAAAYDSKKSGVHPIIIIAPENSVEEWNLNLPTSWRPLNIKQTELVARITYIMVEIDKARYIAQRIGVFYISRIRLDTEVTLFEALSGQTIASTVFRGGDPPKFASSYPRETTAVYGAIASYESVQDWLKDFVEK